MIKLILNPDANPKIYLFTKNTIIIGEGSNDSVDIKIPNQGLHQNHLKIIFKENHFLLINQANDPFVTVNGFPFGKKKLKVKDILQIKDQIIRVEDIQITDQAQPPARLVPPSSGSPLNLSTKIDEPLLSKEPIDKQSDFPDVESLSNEDDLEGWFPTDLNLDDFEKLIQTKPKAIGPQPQTFDEESEKQSAPPSDTVRFSLKGLKWVVSSIFLFFAIFGVISSEIYFRAKSESGGEEVKAATSLADVAMALTYAKVYHIVPQKQNFLDPDFLKNNLIALLASTSIPCGNIDAHGHFSNCSYLLRFYSNQDLSRFLLIAQPAPTLSQWLFPKDAILIDSSLMNLRKIADLRSINRLLANSNPFEGTNGDELVETIKHLKIIPLSTLAKSSDKKEFFAPALLGLIRPGAENLVYNSPRYYLFGETLLKKAALVTMFPPDDQSLEFLKGEIEKLSKYENLVFYTTQGIKSAMVTQKALTRLAPQHSFLTASLSLSPSGEILNSRLILEAESLSHDVAQAEPLQNHAKNLKPTELTALTEFKASCQNKLLPLIRQMEAVLNLSIAANNFEIPAEFFNYVESYKEERFAQKSQLNKLIDRALQNGVTEKQLQEWLEELNLSTLVENRLNVSEARATLPFSPFDFANKNSTNSKINLISNYSLLLLLKNDIDYNPVDKL